MKNDKKTFLLTLLFSPFIQSRSFLQFSKTAWFGSWSLTFPFFVVLNFKNKPLLILISGISYRIYKIAFYSDNYYCSWLDNLLDLHKDQRSNLCIYKKFIFKKKNYGIYYFLHTLGIIHTLFFFKKTHPPSLSEKLWWKVFPVFCWALEECKQMLKLFLPQLLASAK